MKSGRKNDKINAMIEALEEAASHLELSWSDDELEIEQGLKLAKLLRKRIRNINLKIESNYQHEIHN